MKAELFFSPQVLSEDMKIHYFSGLVVVEREGNKISFSPNRETIGAADAFLKTSGLDNDEVRKAMITWKILTITADLIGTLINDLAEKHFAKAVNNNTEYVNGITDKLSELMLQAQRGEAVESSSKNEDV